MCQWNPTRPADSRAAANAPTTSEDDEALTEQTRAVTDCTQMDAIPLTATPHRPTRRELRTAPPSPEPVRAVEHHDPVPVAVSRRSLRTATPAARTHDPQPAGAKPDAAAPAQRTDATRRALRTATHGQPVKAGPSRRAGKIVTALALTGALAASGFAFQRGGTAQTQATDPGRVQVERTAAAATARLTGQATAYADGRHTEALQAAQAALAGTETVVRTAAPVVDPQTLTPLHEAAAALEALLVAEGGAALSTAGVETTAAEAGGTVAAPSADDALRDAAVSRASRAASETRAPLTAPDAAPAPEGDAEADAEPATEVATDSAAAEPEQTKAVPVDLATSTQMLELAAQVTALSTELRTAVDAKVAEEQARALAVAAEAAAAAEMAHKVDLATRADNGEIPTDVLCAPSFAPEELLRCDAAAALEHLNAAYLADFGRDLEIVSSYRSYSEQISTRRSRGWLAAVPGTSNHGLALAVDFGAFGGLGNFSSPSYRWMKNNADDYGWSHPALMERGGGGPQEPWHWEFGTS